MIAISHLDHLVLTVHDIATSVAFYESVLGMQRETFAGDRVALRFGQQKINLHRYRHEFEPKAKAPSPGSADLCLVTTTPLAQAMAQVEDKGVEIIEGPVPRTGAVGNILSFYFRDPDGNLIEVCNYPGE